MAFDQSIIDDIMNINSEGAYLVDTRRKIHAWNREAERITGYLVGGISPFGTRQKLPVIMEERILKFEEILINAGQRGTMLKIAPEIIPTVLDCTVAEVAHR